LKLKILEWFPKIRLIIVVPLLLLPMMKIFFICDNLFKAIG